MTIQEVLEEANRLGLCLTTNGDRILVTPCDKLPPNLRQAILEHRAVLLGLLRATSPLAPKLSAPRREDGTAKPESSATPAVPCEICGQPYPGEADCPRCQYSWKAAGMVPPPKCGWCGHPPGTNHQRCEECFRTYDRERFKGREDEGYITVNSDPKKVRAVLDRRLREIYGRDFPG